MTEMDEEALIDAALAEAHLPALIVALAQVRGGADLLRDAWRPAYVPFSDMSTGGRTPETVDEIRRELRPLVAKFAHTDRTAFAPPAPSLLTQLMNFVAGTEIPKRYLPLLHDELKLFPREVEKASVPGGYRVVVVGAGMSGLLAGIKLKEAKIPFTIVERSEAVGGTWNFNTYPGCRVDSQNHLYSYSFHPNHDWPHRFSTQKPLKTYFEETAERFDLVEQIRFGTEFESARYDEASGTWQVAFNTRAGRVTETYNAVIVAVGQLNRPKIPEFAGRETFAGPQFHSADWRHDVDLTGKDVAVVGTGASAFQLIPEVAKIARHVTVFQRSAPWFSPTWDYHLEVGAGQKWLFRNLPFYADWYRFWLFWMMTEGSMPALKRDPSWHADDGSISKPNQRLRQILVDNIRKQAGERTDLLPKVIPTSPLGGKRTLRDNGQWIETLKRPNVSLVTEKIARVTPDAIVTNDGISHSADAIVYGTGFHASRFLERARIVGRCGQELSESWNGDPKAYLGITVPGFPNFFMIYGPNTNLVSQGSIVFVSECAVNYTVGALRMLLNRGGKSIEPREDVHEAYNARVDAENAQMAWGLPGVENWYKSASGRVSQNWPFPLAEYWDLTRQPNPADYVFR